MVDRTHVWQFTGLLTVFATLGGVLTATLVSPSFRWRGNALSNMGVTGTAAGTPLTVLLFNGGLIAGGLLGLVFAAYLVWSTGETLTGATFGLTVVLMGLVGVFPQDEPAHFPVAAGFYLFISLTLWLDGILRFREGWRERAIVSLALGTANVAGLVVWGLTGPLTRPGLAIPELFGAVVFAAWTVLVSLDWMPGSQRTHDAEV